MFFYKCLNGKILFLKLKFYVCMLQRIKNDEYCLDAKDLIAKNVTTIPFYDKLYNIHIPWLTDLFYSVKFYLRLGTESLTVCQCM